MKTFFTVVGVLFLSIPFWIWLQSLHEALLGFWSLPLGIAQFWLAAFNLMLAFVCRIFSKKPAIWITMGMINLFILMEDLRLYTGDTEGIPMMSWNLNAPQKKEMDCVLPVIQQWEQINPDGLIFLQEVSERNFRRIMDETSLLCMGASYHPIDSCRNRKKETCPGLAICAAKNWSFRRPHHKNFQDQRNYGYFQTELKPPGENEYFNALNIHLESLWRTRYELKTQNMTELLHQNTLRQHEQMGKIEKVLSILKDPVLLVGDFNSVSSMWLHRHLRTDLIDAHRFSGMGFGISAKRYSIPIRVDHLYIQAPMKWSGETRVLHQHTCSDHFPITSWFSLR